MRPSKYLARFAAMGVLLAFGGLFNPKLFYIQLAYNITFLLVVMLDWLFTPKPGALSVKRTLTEEQYLRLPQMVSITLTNDSRAALDYEISDHAPVEFTASQTVFTGKIQPDETIQIQYEATPTKRGEYKWQKISVRYLSLLKLLLFYKEVNTNDLARVYPNIVETSKYYLLSRLDQLSTVGIRTIRLAGASREFESLRDYVRGDDWRQIDWKATAHRQKLTVRNYEAEKNQRVIMAIDTGRLMSSIVKGSSKLDYAINSALTLSYIAINRNDRVGICLFSNKVHLFIPPEKHKRQIDIIMEALYNANYDYYETNHSRCLNYLAANHKKRSMIIMLSDFADLETSEDMTAGIISSAKRHTFIYVGIRDPFIHDLARQSPREINQAYHKAVAIELENDRAKVIETLRHQGAHAFDCRPDEITAPLINKYLELSRLGVL